MTTVPPERWRRIEEVLDGALDLRPDERDAWLDRECDGDPSLRAAVDALIAASEQPTSVLRSPVNLASPLLAEFAGELGDPNEPAPQRVGPWRIVRELGHGGMGTVYLAERDDEQFEKQVAVKLLRRGFAGAELARRFRHERQILATLEHPHIARMLDGGIADGAPYIVMELVDGLPLDSYCREHHLSVSARLALFADVCAAVQYAHQSLIIHRDLKPSNILVTREGQVKLLDFGIAKLMDAGATSELQLTRTGMYLMTPEYAAPEQVRGGRVTTATDVYALGVILYELLVGRRPYELDGRTPAEVERVICDTEPPRPSTAARRAAEGRSSEVLRRRLRGDVDTIVLKALSKDPDRRYPSAAALLDDLERHQQGLPVHARPDTFLYRTGKFVGRHRVAVGVSALAFATVLAAGVRERSLRAQAEAETAKARAVKDFLVGVFGASDPYDRTPEARRDMTARALLDRGRTRVDTALASQPDVQAEMLTVLGGVYANLGLFDDAAPLLERSLASRRKLYGDRHESVAESMTELGNIYQQQGRYKDAEPLLRDALALRRQLHGGASPDVARSLDRLATVLEQQARYADAEPLYREALATRERLLGPRHGDVAESKLNLALLLWWKGEFDASEKLAREAAELRKELLGPRHAMVGEALHNLAQVQQSRGELADAENLFRESLDIKREVFGSVHPRVTVHLNNYARVLRDRGKYVEAEAFYREALALDRQLFGKEHPYIAASLDNLAVLLTDRGEFAEADSLHHLALAMNRKLLGPKHTRVALGLSNIGLLNLRRGDLAAAERAYREALAQYEEIFGPDHVFTATVSASLAAVLRDRGSLAEAETRYRAAVAQLEAPGTKRSWLWIAPVLTGFGRTLVAAGKPDEAKPILERTLGLLSKGLDPGDWRIADARLGLGLCLRALGQHQEAEALLRQSRDALRAFPVAQHRLLRAAEAAVEESRSSR